MELEIRIAPGADDLIRLRNCRLQEESYYQLKTPTLLSLQLVPCRADSSTLLQCSKSHNPTTLLPTSPTEIEVWVAELPAQLASDLHLQRRMMVSCLPSSDSSNRKRIPLQISVPLKGTCSAAAASLDPKRTHSTVIPLPAQTIHKIQIGFAHSGTCKFENIGHGSGRNAGTRMSGSVRAFRVLEGSKRQGQDLRGAPSAFES